MSHLVNPSSFLFNRQTLCKTILENDVDLLTITANGTKDNPISSRDYVVISARVHPGESNASWVMKGVIDYLTSDHLRADALRREFVFKLVPMLNPDGCIIGTDFISRDPRTAYRPASEFVQELFPEKNLEEIVDQILVQGAIWTGFSLDG